MLISRMGESELQERWQVEERGSDERGTALQHAQEYQTANEIFEIMAQNHSFEDKDNSLTANDLVILYKNIEVGTKLISDAKGFKIRKSNQYIETVVYNDESDGSDCCELYSEHDWRDVIVINKERINLLSNPPSVENRLSHKIGDLDIQYPDDSNQYYKHFLFNDPHIEEQLKSMRLANHNINDCNASMFPASLLDYICCKRFEDNYSFYMDNVIRYVTHAIEQLKRISNGDYLTDKAKEKWREVENNARGRTKKTNVLAMSASIPLQVERKMLNCNSDVNIHSEFNVKSLSRILEKKIIVEVPKLIRGSCNLFSKLLSDNLIISCTTSSQPTNTIANKEPRLDVVLHLNCSETGHAMSKINSILVLQPNAGNDELTAATSLLPLQYTQHEQDNNLDKKSMRVLEIHEKEDNDLKKGHEVGTVSIESLEISDDDEIDDQSEDVDYNDPINSNPDSFQSGDSGVALRNYEVLEKGPPFNFISPDDLTISMYKMNMTSVPEESVEEVIQFPIHKKRSPTKVRIKSPYENKSHMLEEKKRKRLLEIRERREKRKNAMNDNSKINKHRYNKGSVMPQSSTSVTKLSITNKSFYNSIYGQNTNSFERSTTKCRSYKNRRDYVVEVPLKHLEDEHETVSTPDKNSKKYINSSYYLDDTVTEMMYTQHSDCSSDVKELFSTSTSIVSNDVTTYSKQSDDLNTNYRMKNSCERLETYNKNQESNIEVKISCKKLSCSQSALNVASPKELKKDDSKKNATVECRKSIDKLYNLMKKFGEVNTIDDKPCKSKVDVNLEVKREDIINGRETSTIQCSDSGTSLKHNLTSSNPSTFSFDKIQTAADVFEIDKNVHQETSAMMTILPKVIISTKQSPQNTERERSKKERKKVTIKSPLKVPENPLKAISQLLHEFENVQKVKQSKQSERKAHKKPEVTFDNRNIQHVGHKKQPRLDQPMNEEHPSDKYIKGFIHRERKVRPTFAMDPMKVSRQHVSNENRQIDRMAKKKIADIIDEVKEAKGEAVRGPSKFNSRLNTLAQPKKSYVQAHSEEYKNRYGRNLMADRLQRLTSTAVPTQIREKSSPVGNKGKQRRNSTDATSTVSVRQRPSSPPPLEKGVKYRRSANNSPMRLATSPETYFCKPTHGTNATENSKNKMVDVESYVSNHYGYPLTASGTALTAALKARVPLVPAGIDLASMPSSPTGEESTAIGSKLHRIIYHMINTKSIALDALTENRESEPKYSEANDDNDVTLPDDNPSSVDSDYRADIFEDKNVKTAVEIIPREGKQDDFTADEISEEWDNYMLKVTHHSTSELQKLGDALHRRISLGSFKKRLRLKNLTLTPKNSKQQIFLLQSGDEESLLLNSTVSDTMKLTSSRSNKTTNIKSQPALMKIPFDCGLPIIPTRPTMVYAFSTYNTFQRKCNYNQSLHDIFDVISGENVDHNKTYCFTALSQTKVIESIPTNTICNDIKQTENDIKLFTNEVSTATKVVANDKKSEYVDEDLDEISPALHKSVDKVNIITKENNIEHMNCTSSLDVLVGLLNEIQKITACHINNSVNCTDTLEHKQLCNDVMKRNTLISDDEQDVMEHKGSLELVSIGSLEKLRKLESRTSIYSLHKKDYEAVNDVEITKLFKNVLFNNPECANKEVDVDFTKNEHIDTCTDVPSQLFPITTTHSTIVTNSLLGILKKSPSTISSVLNCEILHTDSFDSSNKNIIEIVKAKRNVDQRPKIKENHLAQNTIYKKLNLKEVAVLERFHTEPNKAFVLTSNYSIKSTDVDPIFKMKRDILVTVYSMLVFTMFAALTFPEMFVYTGLPIIY